MLLSYLINTFLHHIMNMHPKKILEVTKARVEIAFPYFQDLDKEFKNIGFFFFFFFFLNDENIG